MLNFEPGATPRKRRTGRGFFIGKSYFEYGSVAPILFLPQRPRTRRCFPNERPYRGWTILRRGQLALS